MRLADSNKVVQGLALDVINRIASGMNQPFDKHVKTLAPPVMQILADQKASIRTAAASTLTSIADACGLETLVGPSGSALETPNPVLRKDLLNWLEERLASTDTSLNLIPLTAPLLSCLEDRSADVRKVATALLTRLVESAGYDHVADKVSSLKPASRSLVTPILENAANATGPRTTSAPPSAPLPVAAVKKPTAPTSNSTKLTASASEPPSKLARSGNPSLAASLSRPTSAAGKALKSAAPAHRPATPTQATPSNAAHASTARPRAGPSMLKRPVSTAPPRVPAANLSSSAVKAVPELPLKTTDNKFKPLRASKEVGPLRWSIDGIARLEQVEALHHQMGPHASEALLNQLFSKDHHCEKDFLAALTTLDECAVDPSQAAASYDTSEEDLSAALLANIDLIFKYLSIRLADSGTTIIIKCLDLIEHLLSLSASQACFLSDYEAQCIVPSLVGKVSLLPLFDLIRAEPGF